MIGIGLVIVLLAGVALLLFLTGVKTGGKHGDKKPALDLDLVKNRWDDIRAQQKSPSGMKNSLIEADKLLDYVLRGRGYRGTTMAERLKNAESNFSRRESVWRAHKLRNAIVHDVAYDLVPQQVEHAVTDLGQAIKDLGVRL